ncbi:hypothetical protein [Endozoicomonas numazuensis]|uniref:Uncharacterized protein n=1 Tax=Endozoicomonas numazuensis TaxID=1137799 RepID=A0A081NJS6_9GAMM|nr:hypothetical protein [Endozoicomonas numazuensis]KEQ18699.1 hypothetical protein GZ78_00855 [Endozoicomonas numazuensis]
MESRQPNHCSGQGHLTSAGKRDASLCSPPLLQALCCIIKSGVNLNISEWKSKTLQDLTLMELAYAHLGKASFYQLRDGCLKSILPITLKEINHSKHMEYSKNFVPVAGAFAVIEQVGFCYSRTDIPKHSNNKASPLLKSLYYFAGYPEASMDMKALYALRNSFLHNASLMSIATHSNKPSFYFQFDRHIDEVVQYSNTQWDGNIETFNPEMTTLINPEKIIDLASIVVDSALDCIANEFLQVSLKGGEKELYYRFLKHFN